MPCVSVENEDRKRLSQLVEKQPDQNLTVDVAGLKVRFGEVEVDCQLRQKG